MNMAKRNETSQSEERTMMLASDTKIKTITEVVIRHTSQGRHQPKAIRRENLMNAMSMKRAFGSARRVAALSVAVMGILAAGSNASAQGTPRYVVTSHATLPAPVTGTPPVAPSLQGPVANMAVNSRGDLFVNTGKNYLPGGILVGSITYEFPADGSPAIALFNTPNGWTYGPSGVAVDSHDNVYVTSFYGPGGANDTDSQIYEIPFTNGSYPAPFTYSQSSPPGSCYPASAATDTAPARTANTGVCAVGQYTGAAYYYWQPLGFAVDGQGNSYMYSNYDNTYGGGELGIFYCNVKCNQQATGAGAAGLTSGKLAYGITSIAADGGDDVFWTDGHTVNEVAHTTEQLSAGTSTITVVDSTYINPNGITFDQAGNMYVQDSTGIYETPSVNGALVTASKFLILPLAAGAQGSPAVDPRGNVYYSPVSPDIEKAELSAGTFADSPIGTASAVKTFTIAFNSSVTLGALSVLQAGLPATEFTVAPGTCTSGTSFVKGGTCMFTATFTPNAVGTRKGAIVIADSTGATSTVYLTGNGTGTSVTVDPGTATMVGSGLQTPNGVALDAVGNVFVADAAANAVYEYPVGGGDPVSLGSGLNIPTGVAVDPAGNLFILNQGPVVSDPTTMPTGSVVEVPNLAGTLTTASQTTVISSGLYTPTDLVLDGEGNFFITNTGINKVAQFPSVSRYGTLTTSVSLGNLLDAPTGIALDSSGHVYVASTGTDQVIELGEGFQTIIGAGLSSPTGVAVDASGSVIIADQGTGRLLRVPNEKLKGLNADHQVLLDSPLLYPYSLRLDATGNLYASDSVEGDVYQLDRTSGLVSFGNYNLNTTSGPATIVLSSAGTLPLALGSPLYPAVPAVSGFTVSAGTGATACSGASLTAGSNCTVSSIYTPTVLGAVNYPLNFAAPASNTGAPTVLLSGTGVDLDAATATITVTDPTGPISYGEPFTVSLIVTPTGNTPTPTGLVVFAFDGQNQRPVALDSTGSGNITFKGVNAGQHTVQAHYEGDVNYASVETALLNITINQATALNVLTVTGDSSNPVSSAPNNALSLQVTLTPSVVGLFGGTVQFQNNGEDLGPPVNVSGPDQTTGLYSAFYSTKVLPLGFYDFTAIYSGNSNYAGSVSNAVTAAVSNPTFTVTPSAYSATSTVTDPGVVNILVQSYSNFQGGIDFQCAGLPANAYCVFRPGLASLLSSANALVNTIPPVNVVLQMKVNQSPAVISGSQTSEFGWMGALLASLLLIYARRKRSMRGLIGTSLLVLLSFGGIAALSGCGSSSSSTGYVTPAGNYLVTVTATGTPVPRNGNPISANNLSTTFQVNLTVK
jgi:sugar lactone lactonase YvrE